MPINFHPLMQIFEEVIQYVNNFYLIKDTICGPVLNCTEQGFELNFEGYIVHMQHSLYVLVDTMQQASIHMHLSTPHACIHTYIHTHTHTNAIDPFHYLLAAQNASRHK